MGLLKSLDNQFYDILEEKGVNTRLGIAITKTVMWLVVIPMFIVFAIVMILERLYLNIRER